MIELLIAIGVLYGLCRMAIHLANVSHKQDMDNYRSAMQQRRQEAYGPNLGAKLKEILKDADKPYINPSVKSKK